MSDISFEAWVRDLEGLVEHLGLERFRLLALSQAGAVAIAYAARHPDQVSHLILHGAYTRGRLHREENPRTAEEAQTLLSLTRLGWGQDNPAFRQVFSLQLMPDATKEQLAWYDELMRVSMTPENAGRAEAAMYHINVLDLLPEIITPTLVTHCRYDAGVPFNEGRILASQIPGARFVPLASKNHLLLPGEPAWEQFVQEVHRFLATEPRTLPKLPASRLQADVETPPFVGPEPSDAPQSPFVRRTHELDQLDDYLVEAFAGNGQIAFITGGAGRGKTSLLAEFARRAQKTHNDLIVANGNGNFFAGSGDPFLPFREVLGQLTGEVATRRTGGQIDAEQARRLRAALPQSIQSHSGTWTSAAGGLRIREAIARAGDGSRASRRELAGRPASRSCPASKDTRRARAIGPFWSAHERAAPPLSETSLVDYPGRPAVDGSCFLRSVVPSWPPPGWQPDTDRWRLPAG